jgi:Short C-terminal domain
LQAYGALIGGVVQVNEYNNQGVITALIYLGAIIVSMTQLNMRPLTTDRLENAKLGALICAGIGGVFLVISIMRWHQMFLLLSIGCSGALLFAAAQLQSLLGDHQRTETFPAAPAPASGPVRRDQPVTPDADTIDQLKRLGELRSSGVLTDAEFETKKAELLKRI